MTDRDTAEVPILVSQAVATTTTTIAPTTVAPTLPSTGPTPQTGVGSALGISLLLGGSLLVVTAAQRRRRLVGVRRQLVPDPDAAKWARTTLGLPKINPSAVDWARRVLGIKKRKIDLNIDL